MKEQRRCRKRWLTNNNWIRQKKRREEKEGWRHVSPRKLWNQRLIPLACTYTYTRGLMGNATNRRIRTQTAGTRSPGFSQGQKGAGLHTDTHLITLLLFVQLSALIGPTAEYHSKHVLIMRPWCKRIFDHFPPHGCVRVNQRALWRL